jgi:hypothetical protein
MTKEFRNEGTNFVFVFTENIGSFLEATGHKERRR